MRLSRTMQGTLVLALAVGLLCGAAQVGAQATGGNVEGKVTDANSAAMPGVTVTVTNVGTGASRTTTTDEHGDYRFASLPAGDYTIVYSLQGFGELRQEGVDVNVAATVHIDATLQQATVEETITVTTEAPLLNAAPSIGTTVSQKELESLPLNGRQFANLAILAPGTTLAYNSDPTKPGQLTIQLAGGNGRNVNFVMDGGDNTDDTIGGALQNFNLEAVQEFNIQTMQYKAEYGRSSGGVLTVVTKTGTNNFSGSLYGYFRDDSLNSKTETEKQAGIDKQAYERKTYGASLGGPIVRDKAHFFATYEKTERDTNYTVFTDGAFPTFDGTVVATPFEDELITAKATLNATAKQYLQVRYGYQKNADIYGASPLAAASGIGNLQNEYSSILAGHTAQIGADMLNEVVFQFTKFDNTIVGASNDPLIYYPSGFHTGENLNTPQSTHQKKYQYKDDFSFSADIANRRHDFKVGANYIHEPVLGGDFTTGTAGQYTASEDRIGSPITSIQIFGGFLGNKTPIDQYGVYVQDDWYATDRLTLNVGLRYDYWDGFDLDQRANPLWQDLHSDTRFNEYYYRGFREDDGVLANDDDNFAPRLGFSWDLKGNGKQILRGGWGRFYDFPYTNATILFPSMAVQSLYGLIYSNEDPNGIRNPNGSFFQPGQPLPPNQLPNPELEGGGAEVAHTSLATPYSDQISLGYSWQATDWLGLNFEAVSVDYYDIPYRFRFNVTDQAGGAYRYPAYRDTARMWMGDGRASYDGVNVGFRLRKEKFEFQGFYTYSEAEGNVLGGADEFRITAAEYQSDIGGVRTRRDVTINPLNPHCGACYGPLYTDARHRFTIGGLYRAPWGLTLSGMFRYRSALPYWEHANADLNGDHYALDLRPGVSNVNSGRGHDFKQFDLRLSKEFTFGGHYGVEILAEVFNLFNETNPARPNRFGVASAFAGDPGQGEQQLIQLGARFRF